MEYKWTWHKCEICGDGSPDRKISWGIYEGPEIHRYHQECYDKVKNNPFSYPFTKVDMVLRVEEELQDRARIEAKENKWRLEQIDKLRILNKT